MRGSSSTSKSALQQRPMPFCPLVPINLVRAGIQQRLTHSIVQQSVRTGTYFKASLCATVIEALGKMRFREAPASSLAASLEEVLGASPYFILYCMRLTISGKVPHDAGPVRLPGAAFACATPQGSARSSARIPLFGRKDLGPQFG